MFNNICLFTTIILVHEIGHFLAAVLFKWKVDKIEIYPYGGCTKFLNDLNVSFFQEFFVLMSGPLLQIIFYFLLKDHLNYNDYLIFKNYNEFILLFNLLPIYPLDGGKLLNLLLSLFLPYLKGLKISIYLSLLITIILLFTSQSLTFILVILYLLVNINKEKEKIKMYYNKFLLERYLKKYNFKKTKIIDNYKKFYRSKRHFIKKGNKYYNEKDFLKHLFKCKQFNIQFFIL